MVTAFVLQQIQQLSFVGSLSGIEMFPDLAVFATSINTVAEANSEKETAIPTLIGDVN